jgi:hypothetical protein
MSENKNFIGRDGKTYTYAMVLGRMCLCEVMKDKPSKKKKPK